MNALSLMPGHPHGEMRRDEREITDPAEIDAILSRERVMYIALSCDDVPFLLPVFYVWNGTSLYFHSARAGSKIEIMKKNRAICFAISQYGGVVEDELACNYEARHRTVIGLGQVHFVDDDAEKIAMLQQLMAGFSDKSFTFPVANLTATQVIRIDISSMKGKQHGF
ncbi:MULTISPECIES: pyridoxamine 5'-phosphate oxidase family protein [Raoultella]|uniref:pyridoxamine 5'-phosphate oxidase family protein n=1 Tax=Raoultella TaxID=160674 RepID=UPI0005CB4B1E|nr:MULTISPECIES: pyridoxamine 5'-phosphate oxidase family protein [Raoultella]VTM88443.1 Predicted flavin-nucleotide-binding protein [Raoultella ornithinolytica]